MIKNARAFEDWMHNQTFEESVCNNPFHDVCCRVYDGYSPLDPYAPDPEHVYTKLAFLLKANLIFPEGDVIYVREGSTLHPLGEAISLLAYYMHTDQREARRAADILESNFQGYFPVTMNAVARDVIDMDTPRGPMFIDLKTLKAPENNPITAMHAEYGHSEVNEATLAPLTKFFSLINESIGDPWFAEKMLMYPFNQRIREKSHVIVGNGGNGKSMLMRMAQILYGNKAYTDAPQPNFKGHDAAVISYSFIGKKVVTFNDVNDPSSQFLEWMKRMITGNLEVKTPSGVWMSVPCSINFFMESNHPPQVLNIEAHKRRFVIREFEPDFKLAEEMTPEELDMIGERSSLTAADIVWYIMSIAHNIDDWTEFDGLYEDVAE